MPDEGSILDGLPITRRRLLTGAVLAGVSISEIVEALDADGESGVLYGGIAALNQAYNPAGNLYVGPDSTKSSVNAKSGRVFLATDTQVDYYGDSGSWVKMGIGSSSTPAGPSYFESVTTEEVNNKSSPFSYVIRTDGTNITAIPQVSGMEKQTGTDIGPILNEIILNQLPPTGDNTEANGLVKFKAGDYPGKVNNQILPAGLWLEGEAQNHFRNRPGGNSSHVQPITRLRTDNQMFIPADVDNTLLPFFRLRYLGLEGPGPATADSRIFDSSLGNNRWDVMLIEDCSMVNVEAAVEMTGAHNFVRIRDCTIGNVGNSGTGWAINASSNDYLSITGCDLFGNDVEFAVRITGTKPIGGGIADLNAQFQDATKSILQIEQGCSIRDVLVQRQNGSATGNGINCVADMVTVRDSVIMGGTNTAGVGLKIGGGNVNNEIFNVHVKNGFDDAFFVDNGNDHEFAQCSDDGSQGSNSVLISGAGPAVDVNIASRNAARFGGSIATTGSPTRPRWNRIIGGGPFGGIDLSSNDGQFTGDLGVHDGTGDFPADSLCRWDGSNWRPVFPATFTYTGDGTATQTVAGAFQFETVQIEEADTPDIELLRRGDTRVVLAGSSMPGSFSINSDGGFDVGNGTGDQDPNTNNETYNVYAA